MVGETLGNATEGAAKRGTERRPDALVTPTTLTTATFGQLQRTDVLVDEEFRKREGQARRRLAKLRDKYDKSPGYSKQSAPLSEYSDPVQQLLQGTPQPPSMEQPVTFAYHNGQFELGWGEDLVKQPSHSVRLTPFFPKDGKEELLAVRSGNLDVGSDTDVNRVSTESSLGERRMVGPGNAFCEGVMDGNRFAKLELIIELINLVRTED